MSENRPTLESRLREIRERRERVDKFDARKHSNDEFALYNLLYDSSNDVLPLVEALKLALYYVEGDATHEALCGEIEKILAGEK